MMSNSGSDQTFRNYKAEQAAQYAASRLEYPKRLIDIIVNSHTSSGGQTERLIDVGCGPGIAARQLAPYFDHVTGLDPGQSMIDTARSTSVKTKTGEAIHFEVCSAEEIDQFAEPGTVDMITAATAAHWFDLPQFYTLAAKLLKPGGSIMLWASGDYFCDAETPNAEAVRKLWRDLEPTVQPYELPGNRHCRELYVNLDMPWTIKTEDVAMKQAMSQFDKAASSREEFNRDGAKDDRFEGGYMRHMQASRGKLKALLSTASPVTRWREANKERVEKGEIEDYVEKCARLTRETMAKVPEGENVDAIGFVTSMVLVVIKKRIEA